LQRALEDLTDLEQEFSANAAEQVRKLQRARDDIDESIRTLKLLIESASE